MGFLATKHAAYHDRGRGDFYGSADLEDIIAVIDGRDNIVQEIAECDAALRSYVTGSIAALSADSDFQDALSGMLAGDEAGQARLPGLRTKLNQIADL